MKFGTLAKLDRRLWAGFKIGLPAGTIVLVLGLNIHWKLDSVIVSFGELIISVACAAAATASALELRAQIRRPLRLRRLINDAVAAMLLIGILAAGCVVMALLAFRRL